jgi:hypothetical protein
LRQTFARWAGTQCTNGPSVQIWSNTFHKGKKTLVTQSFSWQGEATRTAISVCMLLKAPDALSWMRVWYIAGWLRLSNSLKTPTRNTTTHLRTFCTLRHMSKFFFLPTYNKLCRTGREKKLKMNWSWLLTRLIGPDQP